MTDFVPGSLRAEEPCLVKAGQGFSVYYRQRFLYSKYAPQKAILQTVENLPALPETVYLCFSPCLCYGLNELFERMDGTSVIICVEADSALKKIAEEKIADLKKNHPETKNRIFLTAPDGIEKLVKMPGHYRRVVPVEMSGGTFFYRELYSQVAAFVQNYAASFWKNRITLVKFGRVFSRNFFKNLRRIPSANSVPVKSDIFTRPIIVFGAGESIEDFLARIQPQTLSKCALIAVDAALPVLLKNKVDPDFVIAVEAQLAIEKAYIGTKSSRAVIIGDLASRPSVLRHSDKNLYFYSEYTESAFLQEAEKQHILPVKLPPLGSVGLAAVYLALLMRSEASVPVFFTGLDFSYSEIFTHARGTPAHTNRLIKTNHFKKIENYDAAFKADAKKIRSTGTENKPLITDTALSNYANLFTAFFEKIPNLFDARSKGLDLNLPHATTAQIDELCRTFVPKTAGEYNSLFKQKENDFNSAEEKTQSFLKVQKTALMRIKELLSKGQNACPPPAPDLQTELDSLLSGREYLYLHFPDGYKCDTKNLSFLKRVRSEIDFFLKDLE